MRASSNRAPELTTISGGASSDLIPIYRLNNGQYEPRAVTQDDLFEVMNQDSNVTNVGAAPSVTGLACTISRIGFLVKLDFTFTNVAVTHTDAAGSGSSGSLKIFDFVQGALMPVASRSNLTFTGDALIDGNQGDMVFIYAFGSAAANAGDKALTGTEADFSAVSGDITLSSFTATSATLLKGAGTPVDGTATAADLYFNESGSAATSEANGVLTLNGTYTLLLAQIGDD